MAVPYTFGNATTSIPLSQLDSNFATAITIGNTAVQLGNTITTMNNLTLANVTVSSGNVTLTSATVPTVIGGTTASSTLTLQSTSGVGTSDAISFKVGNNGATTAMTINTSGQVGIGTTSPGTQFDVNNGSANVVLRGRTGTGFSASLALLPNGSGSGISLAAQSDSSALLYNQLNSYFAFGTNNSERMRIDSSGNVGIGTSSPGAKLDINGTNPSIRIVQTVGGYENYLGVDSGNLAWNGSTNGTPWGVKTQNVERMRIDTSGNVGIGTSSPSSYANYTSLTINGTDSDVDWLRGGTRQFAIYTSSTLTALNGVANLPLVFYTNNSERMRIDSSGNLLVGTTSATSGALLTVNGDASLYNVRAGRGSGAVATNTVFGFQALNSNTTGSQQTVVGYQAGFSMTTTSNLVAVGYQAGYSLSSGGDSVFLGTQAGYSMTSPFNSVAIGYQALYSCSTGADNVCIGANAGRSITAYSNIMIGYQAGYNSVAYTTGNNNIVIGWNSRGSAAGNTNEIVLGSNIAGKGTNTGFISPGGGAVYQGNNSASWSTTSDRRLKKNIVDNKDGLNKISAIRVRNFEYRLPEEVDDELSPNDAVDVKGIQLGVIAQELREVIPECVKEVSTGVLSVDPDKLTWYLINAVQQLKAELDALKGTK